MATGIKIDILFKSGATRTFTIAPEPGQTDSDRAAKSFAAQVGNWEHLSCCDTEGNYFWVSIKDVSLIMARAV